MFLRKKFNGNRIVNTLTQENRGYNFCSHPDNIIEADINISILLVCARGNVSQSVSYTKKGIHPEHGLENIRRYFQIVGI